MRNFSKSKLISFLQCPRRLWLEIHRPELRDDSASEAVFATGNQVGEIARRLHDPDGRGNLISVDELGYDGAFARTAELMASREPTPIFEAAFCANGGLVFADILLPVVHGRRRGWKLVEVKSSTSVKDYHRNDLAIQSHIARSSGAEIVSASVAVIDSSFVYPGGECYDGLLAEHDLTEEALGRGAEVEEWIAGARATTNGTEPDCLPGAQCKNPFPCPFSAHCQAGLPPGPEFPISALPWLSGRKREKLESLGIDDLRHAPDDHLSGAQLRVKQQSVTGEVFFDAEGAEHDLNGLGFPAYFLDFETVSMVVPVWPGTRPYEQIPFQFSLHKVERDGTLSHGAFLDLSGQDPSRSLAENLLESLGTDGPIFTYNAGFEGRVIRELAERLPDLAEPLLALRERLCDLLPVARERYYHPDMLGSWSLKSILPAMFPGLSHENLEEIQDGNAAAAGYLEAIAPETSDERREEIRRHLLDYCHLDTLATVKIWEAFTGRSGVAL